MALPHKKYLKNCTGSQLKGCKASAKEENLHKLWSRAIFFILLLAFLGVTVFVIFFADQLKISKISIQGNQQLNVAEIEGVIENSWVENFLKIIPKNNFLLISTAGLENQLLDKFRKIEKISVVKKFPDTLEVSIQERKALLILCSGQQCYLIDEKGVAYNQADFEAPELAQNNLLKISDQSSREIKLKEEVFSPAYIKYVLALKEALAKLNLNITAEYWTPSLMAEEVDVKTEDGLELYFSTQFPLTQAVGALDLILKKEALKKQLSEIAYFDLRTESKVFYKPKN